MTIEPDTKDWTWVLQRPCPECGLDVRSFPRAEVAGLIRENAAAWHDLLTGPGDHRLRPAAGKWSALEYGCHVRDVLRLYDQRLSLMLTEDGPLFPNWDQDVTAIADRYSEQDPIATARELATAADVIAAHFAGLAPEQWQRTGSRSDGAHFTVESFARYFVHDPVHHLYDVTG
jgi:DinB family protein